MASYTPLVKQAHAFREISLDFTTPAEIFREAIANSLDAYARRIWLRTSVEERRGKEYVIIDLCDDGIGMNVNGVQAFLNLSDSVKAAAPPPGGVRRRMSGYKGHGTKIYYNSEHLEVLTYDGSGIAVYCHLADPRGELSTGKVPVAKVEEISPAELRARREKWGFAELAEAPGTTIRVLGYHQNAKFGLEHERLRDYICWFTRWGSWEPKLCAVANVQRDEVEDLGSCELYLRGLGKEPNPEEYEKVPFGHRFPATDATDVRKLRLRDDVDPLKYYVRTWAFANEPLVRNPDKRIDFVFAIEGEGARRDYNDMLRRQRKERRPGDYLSEERYGLWLGCDFVPVERFNAWVAERSEYTRMHAFVNSDDLDLTANRGSVENTPSELMQDIEETVRRIFAERIEQSLDYLKFEEELLSIERHRHARKEGEDYKRRQKRLESKELAKVNGVEFYSPKTETDLIALIAGVQALVPDLLPFAIRDYDSHFGFDGLATRSKELAINETSHLFVELKVELKKEFNHTFERLDAIICWSSRVKDGETVSDLAGKKGTYHITSRPDGTKARYIVIPDSPRNVEVIVFRELLLQRGVEFRPVGE
ncbi:hypothetical protein LUI11_39265 [Bradyrhizobium diazoefficiens]|nr:hypothetical protein [Bradyrhizobium diazoefficiens]APO55361.1 hypothetical protein BD122_33780 [Bradyrhizobium diazoefficiens]KOY07233.1 hypothetical protein AF336_27860 [Bradyrhizobium diazoefficiens]MCD9293723.1 hypothetical protein [Bradyrhizobium diazoefficiens]MCD9815664.1 hypothetical protein [Bradyrhizobium diazoefficiens]MCD9832737.1 hypothetical protein [Bradyrhizobium diazoefficiens]